MVLALFVAVAAGMAGASTLALRASLVEQLDERVLATSERAVRAEDAPREIGPLAPSDPGGPEGDPPLSGPPSGLDAPGQAAGTVTLTVQDGSALGAYIDTAGEFQQLTAAQVEVLAAVETDGLARTVDLDELGEYRVVASTTSADDLVVTGLSLEDASDTVSRYLVIEAMVAALGVGLAAVLGGVLVRRELRPLERVAGTATRVSELPLHEGEVALAERVDVQDTDPRTEVGQVGAALNRMLGHVEGALAARHESEMQVRRLVADASHELRTPLASIRGYAELVRRVPADLPPDALHAMARVESEARRMTTLVEDMLLLARLDAGRPLETGPVDLTALVLDAVADAHVAGPDHVWLLDLPDPDDAEGDGTGLPQHDATVAGDEDRLRQVLVNLLANARVHTPPGTRVLTAVRPGPEAVTVSVRDDGPGVPADLLPTLFQRFSRGDAARAPGSGSTGLGLAIVDAVVQAHGGQITVDGAAGGTTFLVTLPRSTAGAQ
ncbi:HAMP domain-containing sensor histidine kinase [Actinotalea sp. C106]|uniref:sensor histidine kinase n=1 Tax=Actinotalea sp. C106 TaxID=2908644 RepID=UPI0020290A25|nr:HAMP domain-containing sensor histidine kinase [Actinotalea sp. C106]